MQTLQKIQPADASENMASAFSSAESNVLPLKREAATAVREIATGSHAPVVVGSIYLIGDGTPENPLRINVPALTSAIINSMTSANFMALQNGIAACNSAGATGSIGAGGD
ncbi:hypothetical protein [Variovorax paradoxus]|uniref:Uncharacterized protein n=1 Tax=Variovorax paradoxus TaxID=34073 RepID=A0A6I6HFC7_VARPD|nr:hypothetical protein [Variovorax paradoxus]QGW82264.1 hypothetical protein GOQ09_12035 [Variovorax paradoxus]